MRLARTAAPPPRTSGWQDSNLRSPASNADGVTSSPTARRISIDAGWPVGLVRWWACWAGALVGGRVYFLAFSLAGPDSTPYREVDQRGVLM
jgi:hypothetical protein